MPIKYLPLFIIILTGLNIIHLHAVCIKDTTSVEIEKQSTWNIINKGAEGNNTFQLLERLDTDVLNECPDVVFLMAGIHDMIDLHKFLDHKTFKKTYQKIISRLKENGIETVLLNLTPIDTNAISSRYNLSIFKTPPLTRITKANEIIQNLAEVNGLKLIDLYKEFSSKGSIHSGESSLIMNVANSGTPDGVHTTAVGNKIIAEQIFNYLVDTRKISEKSTLLFFGESITYEQGVHQNENTFSHQLKKMIYWNDLAPYFSIPYEYEEAEGDFKDPFIFNDSTRVSTLEDWEKRRKEIFNSWQENLGVWPDLIVNPNFEVLATENKEDYIQKRIRFEWVPEQMTEGYLLIPYAAKNLPAVVTVYYEPETAIGEGKPDRDFALQLAKRGFVTLSIGTTETTENSTYSLYYPDIDSATVQPLSMLAYAAANAWHLLAGMPEVNKEKIGIMGHSYGGKWAMFASCLFENFAAAVWSDPGIVFSEDKPNINYWEPWYLGYHPRPRRERGIPTPENPARGLYPELLEKKMDLHELHVLMAPRPFLVSGGSEDTQDRWVPLNYSIKANALYEYKDRVGMSNRPDHSPNPESNEIIYNFFEYFLSQ
jgi:lysophospholipase L1-like esterase